MIAHIAPSVLARAYLADEDGHDRAVALLADPAIPLVTGSWTRVEVPSLLDPGEPKVFASSDAAQLSVAESWVRGDLTVAEDLTRNPPPCRGRLSRIDSSFRRGLERSGVSPRPAGTQRT